MVVQLQDHLINSTNQISFLATRKPMPKQFAPLQVTMEMKLVVEDRQDGPEDGRGVKAEKGVDHPDQGIG